MRKRKHSLSSLILCDTGKYLNQVAIFVSQPLEQQNKHQHLVCNTRTHIHQHQQKVFRCKKVNSYYYCRNKYLFTQKIFQSSIQKGFCDSFRFSKHEGLSNPSQIHCLRNFVNKNLRFQWIRKLEQYFIFIYIEYIQTQDDLLWCNSQRQWHDFQVSGPGTDTVVCIYHGQGNRG